MVDVSRPPLPRKIVHRVQTKSRSHGHGRAPGRWMKRRRRGSCMGSEEGKLTKRGMLLRRPIDAAREVPELQR